MSSWIDKCFYYLSLFVLDFFLVVIEYICSFMEDKLDFFHTQAYFFLPEHIVRQWSLIWVWSSLVVFYILMIYIAAVSSRANKNFSWYSDMIIRATSFLLPSQNIQNQNFYFIYPWKLSKGNFLLLDTLWTMDPFFALLFFEGHWFCSLYCILNLICCSVDVSGRITKVRNTFFSILKDFMLDQNISVIIMLRNYIKLVTFYDMDKYRFDQIILPEYACSIIWYFCRNMKHANILWLNKYTEQWHLLACLILYSLVSLVNYLSFNLIAVVTLNNHQFIK